MSSLLLALIGFIGGVLLLNLLGRKAVEHSLRLSNSLQITPLFLGVTFISLVTSLPEIINSIVASWLGHGDITMGNSLGSVFVQLTLTLGILPFVWRKKFISFRKASIVYFFTKRVAIRLKMKNIVALALVLILAILLLLSISTKGSINRVNAITLIISYLVIAGLIWLIIPRPRRKKREIDNPTLHLLITLATLIGIVASSYLVVRSLIILSKSLGIAEFLLSFFVLAIGTSLPELTITLAAAKKRAASIAVGNSLGSCIVGATFVPGIGPLLFPIKVSAKLSTVSLFYLLFIVSIILVLLRLNKGKIDQKFGLVLLLLYPISLLVLTKL